MQTRILHILFYILLLLSACLPAQEASPYNPSKGLNAGLIGFGGGLTISTVLFERKIKPLTPEQVSVLDYDRILPIDRFSTRHYSFDSDETSDKLLLAGFASPFFLMLDQRGRDNFDQIAMIVFQGAMINSALINLSKISFRRPRPYVYNADVPINHKLHTSSRYSFFSGHVATTAYFSFTTAKIYHDLHPDSKARPYVWTAAALLPAAVAYGRMRAGKHFFTDVLTGFVVGSAVALIVPTLHKSAN